MIELTDGPTLTRSRARKIVAGTAVLVVGGGVAFAYWTAGGSGSGEATTGTTEALQVAQTGAAITGLAPGAAAKTLSGTVTNPGDGAVYVGSVTGSVSDVKDANGVSITSTCATGNYAIGGSANVDATVAGGASTAWTGLTIGMLESGSNQDACKGATVVITYASNSTDPTP